MVQNNEEVLKYWNQEDVESMYDKFLIKQEIDLIKKYIPEKTKILDAGCGEGEATLEYSKIKGTKIHAADFSETRIEKAAKRLSNSNNVLLREVDFLGQYELDYDYDVIISQRFLINLMEWELQKKVIRDFVDRLSVKGRLILLEGSNCGVNELNKLRTIFGLPGIPVKWHNLFFDDDQLERYLSSLGINLLVKDGMSEYFVFTRGIRPFFDSELNWNSDFNNLSALNELKELLSLGHKLSRLKIWVGEKL